MRGKAAIVGVAAVVALLGVGIAARMTVSRPDDALVIVNGEPITRGDFTAYQAVLSSDGELPVADSLVIESLVNQALVLQVARSKGITVTEEELDREIGRLRDTGVLDDLSIKATDPELRFRLRRKLLFDAVKQLKTQGVEASDSMVREYISENPLMYQDVAEAVAIEEARPIVEQDLIDAAWRQWLTAARVCATITWHETAIARPTTDPLPPCAAGP